MSKRKGRSAEQVADALRTLEAFRAAGFDPVPLAPRSKRPAHKGWQGKDYHNFNWRAWLRDDGNIGLRLGARDAVIDYDPRNAVPGDDPVARLSEAVGVDLKNAPRVLTGNGGAHYFWALPHGVRLRGKLDDYQGVDFKKLGGFVVAAGSLHPETGKPYRLDPTGPKPANVQPVPKALIEMVQRPDRPERVEGSGVLEPQDLERLLGKLDPADYGRGKYDEWIRLCAAAHDATGGGFDGLEVFARWCARDDAYDNAEAQEAVELHWESFEAGRPNGVTARTLYREVVNAGHGALVRELVGDAERDEAVEALADEPMPGERDNRQHAGRLVFRLGSSIQMEVIEWLWENRFARGKVNSLSGDPGLSKTTFLMTIAAIVTRGGAWPDGKGRAEQGYAIVMSAEDDAADTLIPRFKAAGGDPKYLVIVEPVLRPSKQEGARPFSVAEHIPDLEQMIEKIGADRVKLVGLDPIGAFIGSSKYLNSYSDQDVRSALGPLKQLAEKHDVAALFIGHFKKGSSGKASERVLGSTAFTALARCNWVIVEELRDEAPTGRLLFAKSKQNIGEPVGAVAYRVEGVMLEDKFKTSRLVWDGEVAGSADDLMRVETRGPTKLEMAMAFLEGRLADGRERTSELMDAYEAQGFAEKTVNRAKRKLGVRAYQENGDWFWELPGTGTEE